MRTAGSARTSAAEPGNGTIRVLVAEDMDMVRGALVALLNQEADIEVVGAVSDGRQIVATARSGCPHVAVVDADLCWKDRFAAVAELKESLPGCDTLLLSNLARPSALRQALSAGVRGLMLKTSPPEQLADAVRRVAAGYRVFDADVALASWGLTDCPLTDREVEILQLVSEGDEITEIASALFLSPGTVRNYLTVVVSKLKARNRIDAIRIARKSGWIY
ncbi:response regulator transcription factor [Microbispora sp. RL4-1S]|uniref:Response regulator transcription factor n=1 Tax=Microbispora oryzae TaxID=2806554 RepID=A0A940WCF1_9ACTN|nr:response regulator transcription factor [Microbispora oryzae]MBP2702949.1 response regulator transcription factor [Microbispora oryzae]